MHNNNLHPFFTRSAFPLQRGSVHLHVRTHARTRAHTHARTLPHLNLWKQGFRLMDFHITDSLCRMNYTWKARVQCIYNEIFFSSCLFYITNHVT